MQGDTRLCSDRNINSCKMPWFLFGALLCHVPSVPEFTCCREHRETFRVINLVKVNPGYPKWRLLITFVGGSNH